MHKNEEARAAIESLLTAASNPQINETQARLLVHEAAENARLAFGEFGWNVLIQIAVKQLDEKKLAPLVSMELQALFQSAEVGPFTP